MNENTNDKTLNRVDRDLEVIERMQANAARRYGAKAVQSRSYIREKRNLLRAVYDNYKSKPLTKEEKATLRFTRSQIRESTRQLYPNPYIRLVRNTAVLTFNLIKSAVRIAGGVLSTIVNGVSTPTARPTAANQPSANYNNRGNGTVEGNSRKSYQHKGYSYSPGKKQQQNQTGNSRATTRIAKMYGQQKPRYVAATGAKKMGR